ncbi:MAG: helix-turn-helix domain-containing protein [Anaerolineae bacterium]|nr:helix-turn-helix domain-containing protein [Anaerolineae bacterium]
MDNSKDLIMTIEEVAEYLQLHPLTVRSLARAGAIPAFKVGRQWRVQRSLLAKWLEEQALQNLAQGKS